MKNFFLDFELLFEGNWTSKDEGSTFHRNVTKHLLSATATQCNWT